MASSNIMVTTQDGMSPELVKMSRKMYRKQMRMNKRTMMRQNRDTIMRDGMSR